MAEMIMPRVYSIIQKKERTTLTEKVKKAISLAEGLVCASGLGFIIAGTSVNIAAHGIDSIGSVSDILTLIFAALSMTIALPIFSLFKKNDSRLIQTGYDYIFNSLAVALSLSGIFYAVQLNKPDATLDPIFSYAMMAVATIYLIFYQRFNHYKALYKYRGMVFLPLIAGFGLFLHIGGWQLWSTIGFGLITLSMILAAILAIFSPYEDKKQTAEADQTQPQNSGESDAQKPRSEGESSDENETR